MEKRSRKVALKQGQGVQIGDHGHQTNIFQILQDAGPSLSAQIRTHEFRTLIEERTKDFVGRDYVFAAIDQATTGETSSSGYVVIRGEPGIGKTALAGELVKRRNCVHHFNISSQNIRSARGFLTNICAQLIVRYGLPYASLPAQATEDSGFLSQLLKEASEKEETKPILVVVDALDEAES